MRRDSQFIFKFCLKAGRGKSAVLGDLLNAQILCQMGVNIGQCLLDIRAVEFSGQRDIVGADVVHDKLQKTAVSQNLFMELGRTETLEGLLKQGEIPWDGFFCSVLVIKQLLEKITSIPWGKSQKILGGGQIKLKPNEFAHFLRDISVSVVFVRIGHENISSVQHIVLVVHHVLLPPVNDDHKFHVTVVVGLQFRGCRAEVGMSHHMKSRDIQLFPG